MNGALAFLLWLAPAALAAEHSCAGGENGRYGYSAAQDSCRSEQAHLCRCRKDARKNLQAYYDASRDLCLDEWVQFQCLEKGGDWICRSMGRCLCDAKPRRCKDADLTAWKDFACGAGDCEDTRLLQGREPKGNAVCKGGGRWRCAASLRCPKTGKKLCAESDFGPWRATGCGLGCARGEMRLAREKKTHLLCDETLYKKCGPDPACASR